MGQFDNVDLGSNRAMQRMIRKAQDDRHSIMLEIADLLSQSGHLQAAIIIQDKIKIEQKEQSDAH